MRININVLRAYYVVLAAMIVGGIIVSNPWIYGIAATAFAVDVVTYLVFHKKIDRYFR